LFQFAPLIIVIPIALLCAIGLAIAMISLMQRRVDRDSLRKGHDVAGAIYAVIGTIYAALIAFVVIVVWEQFTDAELVCQQEASHIGNLQHMASAFPDSNRREIENRTADYLRSVIDREWPTMADGREDSVSMVKAQGIWEAFRRFRPLPADDVYYRESVRELTDFNSARRTRILDSRAKIHPYMWAILLTSGVIVIAFTYLFAAPKKWNQYAVTAGLTAIITLSLILIQELDGPFAGSVTVEPDAFQYVLDHTPTE